MKANLQPGFGEYLDVLRITYYDMINFYRPCEAFKKRLIGIDEDLEDWLTTASLQELEQNQSRIERVKACKALAHKKYALSEHR